MLHGIHPWSTFFFYRKIELGISFHNSFIENKKNDPNICKKHSWPTASIHRSLLLIMNSFCSLPIIIDCAFNSELQWTIHPLEKQEGDRKGGNEEGKKKGREGWREEGGSKRGRKRDKWEKRKRTKDRKREYIHISNFLPFLHLFYTGPQSMGCCCSHIHRHIQKCVLVISEVPPGSIMLTV